jgi:Mg2+/Co2+ transporter CorB
MAENYQLWQEPLGDICGKAGRIKVRDIEYTPIENNCLEHDATLNEAIHRLVVGYHQNLLVVTGEEKEIVGVLRLYDVFKQIYTIVATCELE